MVDHRVDIGDMDGVNADKLFEVIEIEFGNIINDVEVENIIGNMDVEFEKANIRDEAFEMLKWK